MAHIANIKPNETWGKIEDLISSAIGEHGELETGKTYTLHSNGGNCWIVQQEALPNKDFLGYKLTAGQDYTFVFDTEIYLQSTVNCDIDIEDAVSGGGGGASGGMKAVHLIYDGTIYNAEDAEQTPLTYLELKSLIEDMSKYVFLTNGNYEFTDKYKYTKMSGEDVDAIGFFGETYLEGIPYLYRIAINENNDVIDDEIPLERGTTKIKVVSELPANPDADTLYFITEA